jgi:Transposase, Mutator family
MKPGYAGEAVCGSTPHGRHSHDQRPAAATRALQQFVRGLSMRDVESLCEQAGPGKLSKSTASRICQELRERFEAFKRRDLYDIHLAALFLDAVFLSVRPDGPKEGVLVAWGFTEDGERVLLSVMLGMRESHEDWLELGRDLIARGLGARLTRIQPGRSRSTRTSTGQMIRRRAARSEEGRHPSTLEKRLISVMLAPPSRDERASRSVRADARVGRAPGTPDRPPLTPAPPWRSRCPRESDPRARRSSRAVAPHLTADAPARVPNAGAGGVPFETPTPRHITGRVVRDTRGRGRRERRAYAGGVRARGSACGKRRDLRPRRG